MIVTLSDALGVRIPEGRAFRHRTVRSLAVEVAAIVAEAAGTADHTADGTAERFGETVDRYTPLGRPRTAPRTSPRAQAGPTPVSAGQAALLYEYRVRQDEPVYNVVHQYRLGPVDGEPIDIDRLAHGADRRRRSSRAPAHAVRRAAHGAPSRPRRPDRGRRPARRSGVRRPGRRGGASVLRPRTWTAGASHDRLPRRRRHRCGARRAPRVERRRQPRQPLARPRSCLLGRDPARPALHGTATTPNGSGAASRRRISTRGSSTSATIRNPSSCRCRRPLAGQRDGDGPRDGYVTRPLGVTAAELHDAGMRPMPFFLATFAALLQRYTDTDDVVIGTVASTRDHPDVAEHVGYFLNVLPLRLTVTPDSTPAGDGYGHRRCARRRARPATRAVRRHRRRAPSSRRTASRPGACDVRVRRGTPPDAGRSIGRGSDRPPRGGGGRAHGVRPFRWRRIRDLRRVERR